MRWLVCVWVDLVRFRLEYCGTYPPGNARLVSRHHFSSWEFASELWCRSYVCYSALEKAPNVVLREKQQVSPNITCISIKLRFRTLQGFTHAFGGSPKNARFNASTHATVTYLWPTHSVVFVAFNQHCVKTKIQFYQPSVMTTKTLMSPKSLICNSGQPWAVIPTRTLSDSSTNSASSRLRERFSDRLLEFALLWSCIADLRSRWCCLPLSEIILGLCVGLHFLLRFLVLPCLSSSKPCFSIGTNVSTMYYRD